MSRPKLLLADDSITIQKVVNLTFADHGMDVIAFSDGDSAVENLDAIKPDIVLADVHMPGINGYQLCELMRSDAANRHTPVLLLVGSFEPFDREEAERVGANGHMTKPFTSIAELVSMVESLIASSSSTPETTGVEQVAETDHVQSVGPDTSDIDKLYEQSFVETVEIPGEEARADFGLDEYDDEMIQTSYAGSDTEGAAEESLYSEDTMEFTPDMLEYSDGVTEALIADSLPKEESEGSETRSEELGAVDIVGSYDDSPTEDDDDYAERVNNTIEAAEGSNFTETSATEGAAEETLRNDDSTAELPIESSENIHGAEEATTGDDVALATREEEPDGDDSPIIYDPFESVADDLPVEPPPSPITSQYTFAVSHFGLDDTDLLELPASANQFQTNGGRAQADQVANLSPELIDMIVDKVLERLRAREEL